MDRLFARLFSRRLCLVLAALALGSLGALVGAEGAAAAAVPASWAWAPPVAGPIVHPFEAPRSAYGPGHRGIDFAAAPGTAVRAAGDGTVVFAGDVARSLHVVVAHHGGLRTSYSFLAQVDVHGGQRVRLGDVLGAAGGSSADHPVGLLHFGLRVGDRYVDPMVLFRPPDLARVVHLAPVDGHDDGAAASWGDERAELGRSLGLGGPIGGLAAGARWLLGAAQAPARELARFATDVAARTPLAPVVHDAREVASRMVAWARSRRRCTAHPPRPDGKGGSGHLLMAVAGIGSETDPRTGASLDLATRALGYRDDEVRYFSYAPAGGPYREPDSWGDLHVAAVRLGEQLEQLAAAHPGREVDLVAHSQGGVVVDLFLHDVYNPSDPAYPPLGTVVTLSSPHRGAPIATAATEIGSTRSGTAVLQGARRRFPDLPPAHAPSVRQLAESSPALRDLRRRLPDQIDLTSIGAPDDVVVPATQIGGPGATQVLVDPKGLVDDHGGVVTGSRATAALLLALEGRDPPCVSAAAGLRGAIEPVVITRVEHTIGAAGRRLGQAVDALDRPRPG